MVVHSAAPPSDVLHVRFRRFARGIAQVTEQHLRVVQLLLSAALLDAAAPAEAAAAGGGRGRGRGRGQAGSNRANSAAQAAAKEQQVSKTFRGTAFVVCVLIVIAG
jgi:hypothetical protein